MKKYIAPSLQVVNIQNENILAGSTVGASSTILTGEETGFQRGARGHRGLTDFDDDEE